MPEKRAYLYDGDRSPEAVAFLNEVIEVSRRHGFLLLHEDSQGGFIMLKRTDDDKFTNRMEEWIADAAEEVRRP